MTVLKKPNQQNQKQHQGLSRVSAMAPRSWLFVPASRPDRFDKALATEADAVIIDLEDAVDPTEKEEARANIVEFFANELDGIELTQQIAKNQTTSSTLPQIWIRLNNDEYLEDDLVMCGQLPNIDKLAGVLLPKVATADVITQVYGIVEAPVVIQIETALGVSNLVDIAKAEGLRAISFGRLDICNDLNLRAGSAAEQDFFKQLRVQVVVLSKANGLLAPIESIYADFNDTAGLSALAQYASDLGFAGMLCIHPSQVSTVNQSFSINDEQLRFAEQVVAHYQKTGEIVFAINSVMVDLPVILQCRRILSH